MAIEGAARDLQSRPRDRRSEFLGKSELLGKSTVGEIVKGVRLPRKPKLLTFLAICEIAPADLSQWLAAWERASTARLGAAQSVARPATITAAPANAELFGRDWLTAELDRQVGARTAGYLFLEGDAGVGKTAFLTALVGQRHYPAHFIRRGDSRSTAEGVRRDLAGQVLDAFDLDGHSTDQPSRTWTPDGFADLLERAAERLTPSSHLMIVIDALDESDPVPESLPLGLPPVLPPAVFIVLSYRTGTRFRRPAGAGTLTIGTDDPRNMRDVRRFLEVEAAKADIAAALRAAEVRADRFVDQLTRQCHGVWVYLQYVLAEIRQGLRRADDLDSLPESLTEYYMINITSAEHTSDWHSLRLPVLSTLAAAGAPLPASAIARFAGVTDVSAVQELCDFTWRPFLSVTSQDERQYAIYHASLREFLRGGIHDRSDHDDLCRIRSQLRVASCAAHDRFAGLLLAELGGLHECLPGLASGNRPGAADRVGRSYALRHLPSHLEAAGRADELHRLLACVTTSSAGDELNLWFDAHDRAGTLDSYLDDLDRARRAAELCTDQQLRSHRPAASLGLEVRYALLAASVRSSNHNIPANLLARLVDHGVWELDRAVAHTRGLAQPSQRFKSLLCLYHHGSVDQQQTVLAAAAVAASEICSDSRADALAQLAPLLGQAGWLAALTAAGDINDEDHRSSALVRLAPTLPDNLVEACLATASRLQAPYPRYKALTAVAARLDRDRQAAVMMEAYTAAMQQLDGHTSFALKTMAPLLPHHAHAAALSAVASWEERSRSFALESLAPFLPDDLLACGLALADELSDPEDAARALTALATRPVHGRHAVLTRALTAARSIPDPKIRAEALGHLADQLPSGQRTTAVTEALAAVRAMVAEPYQRTWDREYDQERALILLARKLPRSLVGTALDIATRLDNEVARERALVALAPMLPKRLLAKAVDAASPARGPIGPAALVALGERLPAGLLARAIAAAAEFNLPHTVSTVLRQLARHLPESDRAQVLEQSLAAARAVSDGSARADALARLATCLAPDRTGAVLAEALEAVLEIDDSGKRYRALLDLLPCVPAEQRPQLVRRALATARRIHDGSRLARALATLTTHLAKDADPVLQAAHEAAARITDETEHADALTTVATALPAARRSAMVAQALDAVAAIPDTLWNRPIVVGGSPGSERARALLRLAPLLSGDQLKRARAIAAGVPDRRARIEALVGLAAYPHADQLATLADAVLATSDGLWHERPLPGRLADLAPRLPAHLLGAALDAALRVVLDFPRAQSLAALAPSLPAELIPRALKAALSFDNEVCRTIALAPLTPMITPRPRAAQLAATLDIAVLAKDASSCLEQNEANNKWRTLSRVVRLLPLRVRTSAFTAALTAISDTYGLHTRSEALVELAGLIPAKPRKEALNSAVARAGRLGDPAKRARSLADFVAMLPPERRSSVVRDILDAIAMSTDESAEYVLTEVAPHVPTELAHQAFALAEAVTDGWQQAMTLVGLAPVLPDDLRLRAAQVLLHTTHPAKAGQVVRNKQYGDWPPDTLVTLLRSSLRDRDRATVVAVIAAFAPAISRIGGQKAWQEVANAINQTYRWWP
jgi:hypothetical protein